MKLKKLAVWALALTMGQSASALAQDTLTVGITTTGVPFTFVDTETQAPTGAMVDIAKAIAADNGMDVKFEITAFSALIPALTTGKIDLISAGMLATDKRKEVVDFSTPVYSYGETMFVAADDPREYTVQDLKGETVGAQVGTVFADRLRALGIFGEVKLYDSLVDIMRDVKLGRIKAGFGDKPIIAYQTGRRPELGVRIVNSYESANKGDVALSVAKDNTALLGKVNASIAKLKENGDLAKILAAYGL